MKSKIILLLSGLLLNFTAQASFVLINNSGFESNILNNGGFIASATGWNITGNVGTFNPTNNAIPGGNAPEGNNVAFIGGGSLTQQLSTTLTKNTTYTLSVDVIERLDVDINDYTIQLFAGNNVIAEDASSLDPGNGNFLVSTLQYTASEGDPLLGSQLSIALSSNAQQVNFDDIKLNATSISAVPIPAGIWLFGSGVISLIGMRKKKEKNLITTTNIMKIHSPHVTV